MTTNAARRAQADKDFRAFMTFCIAGMFLFHLAVACVDAMIIA